MSDHLFEHAFEAPVLTRAESGTPVTVPGTPSDDALAAINERCAITPQEADQIFTWWLEGSNNAVDSHGTWMDHETTLRNYMQDVSDGAGVPYMRNHATGGWSSAAQDPHGRLFDGVLVEGPAPAAANDDGPQLAREAFGRTPKKMVRALMQAYMRRGIVVNGQPNDGLIGNLEAGVQRSNSVGFSVYSTMARGSSLECDICAVDLFERGDDGDFVCSHMPGLDYQVARAGGGGDTQAERVHVIATAKIVGARLREVSGVYLGSTPGTYTLAQRGHELYETGKLDERAARQWEEMHRLQRGTVTQAGVAIFDMGKAGRMPAAPSSTGGSDVTKGTQDDLATRIRTALADNVDRVAAFELALDGGNADPVAALVRMATDEVAVAEKARVAAEQAKGATVKALRERLSAAEGEPLLDAVDRLAGLAELGRGAKDRLIDEALRQMTRAGLGYDAAKQRGILDRLEPDEIEEQTTMFKSQADGNLAPGRTAPNSAKPKAGDKRASQRPNVALSS